MNKRTLVIIGLIGAVVYMAGWAMRLFWLEFIAKPIPVLCMMVWLWQEPRSRYRKWVTAGLLFSMIGDLFMTVPDRMLIFGMGAFALAHICYVAAYIFVSREIKPLRAIPFIIWCSLIHYLLAPKMGEMLIPVTLYMVVIGAMMWRAAVLVRDKKQFSQWIALMGALVFAISDSILAFRLFDGPFPADRYVVIITYWSGQWLIARSTFCYPD